jgi:hypothetical protein
MQACNEMRQSVIREKVQFYPLEHVHGFKQAVPHDDCTTWRYLLTEALSCGAFDDMLTGRFVLVDRPEWSTWGASIGSKLPLSREHLFYKCRSACWRPVGRSENTYTVVITITTQNHVASVTHVLYNGKAVRIYTIPWTDDKQRGRVFVGMAACINLYRWSRDLQVNLTQTTPFDEIANQIHLVSSHNLCTWNTIVWTYRLLLYVISHHN